MTFPLARVCRVCRNGECSVLARAVAVVHLVREILPIAHAQMLALLRSSIPCTCTSHKDSPLIPHQFMAPPQHRLEHGQQFTAETMLALALATVAIHVLTSSSNQAFAQLQRMPEHEQHPSRHTRTGRRALSMEHGWFFGTGANSSASNPAAVFTFMELGFPCWRVPTVVLAPSTGRLFAFAEARNYSGDGCYPHTPQGLKCLAAHTNAPGAPPPPGCEEGPRSLALKTSVDGGVSWSPARIVVRALANAAHGL